MTQEEIDPIIEQLARDRPLSEAEVRTLFDQMTDEQRRKIVEMEGNNEHMSAARGSDGKASRYLFKWVVDRSKSNYNEPYDCPYENEDCFVGDRCIDCCINEATQVVNEESEVLDE